MDFSIMQNMEMTYSPHELWENNDDVITTLMCNNSRSKIFWCFDDAKGSSASEVLFKTRIQESKKIKIYDQVDL